MISIKDIRTFQINESNRIHELGAKIHPKLLRRLTFHDIMDPLFDAKHYDDMFAKYINQEIISYNKKLRDMLNQHLHDYVDGWITLCPDSRFAVRKSDGSDCYHSSYMLIDNYDDYIFDLEIEDYCKAVYEMLTSHKITPYWRYSHYMTAAGYQKFINDCTNGVNYIRAARDKFKGYKTTYEALEEIAVASNSLPYKMELPPINNDTASAINNSGLQKCIKHHLVLNAFFEKYTKEAEPGYYESWVDSTSGKIKFLRTDI